MSVCSPNAGKYAPEKLRIWKIFTQYKQIKSKIYVVWKVKQTEKTMESPERVNITDSRITLAVFRAVDGNRDRLIAIEGQSC